MPTLNGNKLPSDDALVTGAQAARMAGVSKQLVNYWRVKGHLQQVKDKRYRLGDVLRLERTMRITDPCQQRQQR